MRKVLTGLTVLLAVQLVAAGLLLSGNRGARDDGAPIPLLAGGSADIDRIVIADGDGSASLVRAAAGWELPGLGDLPASEAGLTAVLDRLGTIATDWPVTATASSHQRFEVATDTFQRRVQLFHGDQSVADFYLGTSPGFRQVHLRRAGEDAVYVVELSVHDLPADDAGWLDKGLLAVVDPVRIEGPDFVISKSTAGDWQFAGGAREGDDVASQAVNADQAGQLVTALVNLRVLEMSADRPVAAGEPESGPYTLAVEAAGGSRTFQLRAAGDHCYVARDDVDALFTLSQFDYDRIVGITRAALSADGGESGPGEG